MPMKKRFYKQLHRTLRQEKYRPIYMQNGLIKYDFIYPYRHYHSAWLKRSLMIKLIKFDVMNEYMIEKLFDE